MAEAEDTEDPIEENSTGKRSRWKPPKNRLTKRADRVILDYDEIADLAMMQCTQVEIAAFCGCTNETLRADPRFMEIYETGMNHGRISVRRAQFNAMEDGDRTMLVWLGKQYLGQRDSKEITGAGGEPLIPQDSDMDTARRLAYILTKTAIKKASEESKEPQ